MGMEFCVVAFIDVLGFSAMVKADASTHGEKYLDAFREILDEVKNSFNDVTNCLDVKMFSDSIVLAASLTPVNVIEVLSACAQLQQRFLAKGILLRGGVSYGKHFADATVMFSEGLIAAYYIESKLAKYPRIVVDKNVIDYFSNHVDVDDVVRRQGSRLMIQDRDKVSFIHYLFEQDFDSFTLQVSGLIHHQLKASEAVLEKLRWLSDYHAYCAESYSRPHIEVPSWFKRMQAH